MEQKQTFSGLMRKFGAAHDPKTAFDDFLTILLAGFGTANWKPGDALPYAPILEKYGADAQRLFPQLIKVFADEFEHRRDRDESPDILGEFYELHFPEKPPYFFLPWPICKAMVRDSFEVFFIEGDTSPIFSHTCGSGRVLLALLDRFGYGRPYYGVDTDPVCAKMCAITLFMAGMAEGEVVCGNPLTDAGSFTAGWRLSKEPLGIFPLAQGESRAWRHHVAEITKVPLSSNMDEHGSPLADGLHIRFDV